MTHSGIDIFQILGNAGWMVKFVLFLLLFFSVTSWTIIIIKWRYIYRAFHDSAVFTDYFWKSRDLASAFNKAKELTACPMARIFRIGYVELKKTSQAGRGAAGAAGDEAMPSMTGRISGADNVKRALRRAITSETTRMTQMVPFLATTGNTTPFIGLFGTVWGIMSSFHSIGQQGSASLAVVAPGISEALIATAAGLAVAIPAVIAFNFFMQKIRVVESELISFSADFLNIIERDILAGSVK
ncbi:MAG: MotA/TolQ/ExbB proton channel family protein [Desulfobacteraceae bacterium]|nr:MotA/TolQ/ExbB proton channel family protein [Desulfobacteraceae bacterium]